MQYFLAETSSNKKTGPMPVGTSSRKTCPTSCAFYKNGCYADSMPLRGRWDEVTNEKRGYNIDEYAARIAAFVRPGSLWRHAQAGDLPGDGDKIDFVDLKKIVDANKSRKGRGFTFTHKPVLGEQWKANADAIAYANKNGFTINLSANNLTHADDLMALNIAPVVAVVASDAPEKMQTPAGHVVVVCPAQTHDGKRCIDCGLCAKVNRKTIIGFRAHGTYTKKANEVCKSGAQ